MTVLVNVDSNRRIRVYVPEGGCSLEARVDSAVGWVLDNDAEVSDEIIGGYLEQAAQALRLAADRMK